MSEHTNGKTGAADNPIALLRAQVTAMTPELKNALPGHIKPEKFARVVLTVVQQQPELLATDRRSLLGACMKCAADGLVPDGREAALVIFNTKVSRKGEPERWEKRAQYMPMLTGVLKRARNSGEIAGIVTNVIYEADEFTQRPDDFDRPIEHRPPKLGTPRGNPIGAYAIARLKDGTVMSEVMDRSEIERIRSVSRSKDSGPWKDWWDQMARKSVLRRLAKYLPMDAEAEDFIRRDEEADSIAPTISGSAEPAAPQIHAPSKLDALEETGEIVEGEVEEGDGWPGPTPAAVAG